ncbi:MAG: tRNA (adenosine(37)-N6)-threonylcarbamoyltransferase complex ATPase subunit type 1 TsaE [Parcubacteria group bacterium]|nr:tRNA (adenosine(37)-N6)-threonylcarbamoyltransferase complex ATPase subunit type 1 TsaE [Parcubacteria group bacterium]
MKIVSKSLEETCQIAKDFAEKLSTSQKATVLGFYGDLGSGKTTFTQNLALALGITETVTSPTFVIEKIYKLKDQKFTHLIHIDAYRIEKSSEMLHLGWQEIIDDSKNLIVIEWPERIADILPADVKKIEFIFIDETTREIVIN